MLERASDMELTSDGETLNVRIINNSGHKLPTGYPEGRRMWINVRFFDAQGLLIAESGHYDPVTADLTHAGTKIYECEIGPDAAVAALTGLTEGPSFHFALNNKVYKDNRIPPRGFTNAKFESIQALPVGATYADGQYWDDTPYGIPCDAASAEVTVFHQTTSKEYIEFLLNENTTNNAGQIAYDQWVAHGKSAPVVMDQDTIFFEPRLTGDVESISVSAGGAFTMCVNAGPSHAGKLYWVLGSLSGTTPGFPLSGLAIPLNFDAYTTFTINKVNTAPLAGSFGVLDADGQATCSLTIPAGAFPWLAGQRADHAYGVIQVTTAQAVSNPAGVDFLP